MQLRLPFDDLPDRAWRVRSLLKIAWIPAVVAFLVYWPVLGHEFLSDDEVILNYIFRQDVDTPALNWDVLMGDFFGSWLGLKHVGYYRPFINLIFAFSYVFGGLDPVHYYLHNLLLHILASVLCGMLCAMAVRSNPRLTFLVGSVLFAVHPAGHEVVCWISARNSGLDVSFRLASMVCFCAAIRPHTDAMHPERLRRRAHIFTVFFAWCALMCKETAVTLAVCYLALDIMIRPQRAHFDRVKLHMLYGLVWLGYLFQRWMMVGMDFGKMPMGQGQAYIDKVWGGFQQRVSAFFWPRVDWDDAAFVYDLGSNIAGGLVLIAFVAVGVWAVLDRRRVFWIVLGPVWALLVSFPNMSLPVDENLYGSRYLYASAAILLTILCRITVGQETLAPRVRWFLIGALAISIPPMLYMDWRKIDHYRISSEQRITLQKEFDELAADVRDDKPMAVVFVERPVPKVPFTNPNSLFTIAEIPFASRNVPFISLTTVLQNLELSGMAYDVEPLRAVWDNGGKVACYTKLRGQGLRFERLGPPKTDAKAPPLKRVAKNRFEFEGLCSVFMVEGLRIRVPKGTEPTGGRLRWIQFDGKPLANLEFPFGPAWERGEELVFEADIRPDQVIRMEFSGGLKGVEIIWEGADVEASSVEVVQRAYHMELERKHRGARLNLKDVGPALIAPTIPQEIVNRKGYHIELVFMSGAYPLHIISDADPRDGLIKPGDKVVLPTRAERLIEGMARLMRQDRFYYYFTVRGPGLGARSDVDWFVVDVREGARRRRGRQK